MVEGEAVLEQHRRPGTGEAAGHLQPQEHPSASATMVKEVGVGGHTTSSRISAKPIGRAITATSSASEIARYCAAARPSPRGSPDQVETRMRARSVRRWKLSVGQASSGDPGELPRHLGERHPPPPDRGSRISDGTSASAYPHQHDGKPSCPQCSTLSEAAAARDLLQLDPERARRGELSSRAPRLTRSRSVTPLIEAGCLCLSAAKYDDVPTGAGDHPETRRTRIPPPPPAGSPAFAQELPERRPTRSALIPAPRRCHQRWSAQPEHRLEDPLVERPGHPLSTCASTCIPACTLLLAGRRRAPPAVAARR